MSTIGVLIVVNDLFFPKTTKHMSETRSLRPKFELTEVLHIECTLDYH